MIIVFHINCYVELQKFDIMCFTETWLNTNVANQNISLDNFQSPFRKDRVDRLGGGVTIYVKNDYHVVHFIVLRL
jgi:hypothetical protein